MQHFSLKWQTALLMWPAAEVPMEVEVEVRDGCGQSQKDVPWMDLCVADRSFGCFLS